MNAVVTGGTAAAITLPGGLTGWTLTKLAAAVDGSDHNDMFDLDAALGLIKFKNTTTYTYKPGLYKVVITATKAGYEDVGKLPVVFDVGGTGWTGSMFNVPEAGNPTLAISAKVAIYIPYSFTTAVENDITFTPTNMPGNGFVLNYVETILQAKAKRGRWNTLEVRMETGGLQTAKLNGELIYSGTSYYDGLGTGINIYCRSTPGQYTPIKLSTGGPPDAGTAVGLKHCWDSGLNIYDGVGLGAQLISSEPHTRFYVSAWDPLVVNDWTLLVKAKFAPATGQQLWVGDFDSTVDLVGGSGQILLIERYNATTVRLTCTLPGVYLTADVPFSDLDDDGFHEFMVAGYGNHVYTSIYMDGEMVATAQVYSPVTFTMWNYATERNGPGTPSAGDHFLHLYTTQQTPATVAHFSFGYTDYDTPGNSGGIRAIFRVLKSDNDSEGTVGNYELPLS